MLLQDSPGADRSHQGQQKSAPGAGGAECWGCRQNPCPHRSEHPTEKSLCLLCASDIAYFTHAFAVTAQCLFAFFLLVSTMMLNSCALQGQPET